MRSGLLTAGMGGLVLWYVLLGGALLGASVGYAADSPAETTISYNGTHVIMAGNATDATYDREAAAENQGPVRSYVAEQAGVNSDPDPDGPVADAMHAFTRTLYRGALHLAVATADVSATASYYASFVVPPVVLSGLFHLLAVVPLLGAGYKVYRLVEA